MNILFIVIDGLSEKPIRALGNRTPLEAAKTPNLDWLAENGVCGLLEPVFTQAMPTSEEGHFALFGYNPKKYHIRRGIFTALGAGLKIRKGDVALRGNFATVDNKKRIIDRRAGRIKKTKFLIKALQGIKIKGVKFLIASAGQHRLGIIMRGRGLSSQITDGDPHYSKMGKRARKINSFRKTKHADFTAQVLNKFLEKAHQILKEHPLNKKREKKGLFPANYVLIRGASSLESFTPFEKKYRLKACCIAGKLLYKQIGKFLGMDLIKVRGANGLPTTNLRGKFLAAKKVLCPRKVSSKFGRVKKYNFVFLHIKATDSLAEDGKFEEKKKFIEKIDKRLKICRKLKNILVVVTADHSTCCSLKRHCSELIPVLIYLSSFQAAKMRKGGGFSEKSCAKGELGKIEQTQLMSKILKYAK